MNLRSYGTRVTPQSEPIPSSTQVANSAGGYSWPLDDWQQLERFLVLGTQGGTYYIKERSLTKANADAVLRCIAADGIRVVDIITAISDAGRASSNDPALFALAACFAASSLETKRAARAALPKVARIGTHLFHFAAYVEQFRGWGRNLKGAVGDWYNSQTPEHLSYDAIKYQQRDGWGHSDLVKLSHPKSVNKAVVYDWIVNADRKVESKSKPDVSGTILEAYERVQALGVNDIASTVKLITDNRLPREALPTEALKHVEVWDALLNDMPLEAMIRNLGNMSAIGLIKPFSSAVTLVTDRLSNEANLRRSRIHPIKVLAALLTYGQGHGIRGSNKWDTVPQVVSALDAAFYKTFVNVEPIGKNILLALDVSGSMQSPMNNMPYMSCAQGTTSLALVTANVEPNYFVFGFDRGMVPLSISKGQRLDDAMKVTGINNGGGTDCALPMVYAMEHHLDVDAFVVLTDNETWAGNIHPAQALNKYRQSANKPKAKLIVVAMESNGFSVGDPNDAGTLNVVGFDTNTPAAISEFVR